ncbi:MAG: porin family protein [Paludibacter sp.]|nr:porin family protein [Paludibacter sp.]
MVRKLFCLLLLAFALNSIAFAQLGIRAGVNMANHIKSFRKQDIIAGFKTENLTGYQIGLTYQIFSQRSPMSLGSDVGIFVSQKGFAYADSTKLVDIVTLGYKEINYLELPVNLRFRFSHKLIGAYATSGFYAGYVMNGKSVNETNDLTENLSFSSVIDRFDYGYCIGAGIEFFKKINVGLSWTQGLKNLMNQKSVNLPTENDKDNRVFSVNLTYIIK